MKLHMSDAFLDDIKFNCDVSDAKYWGYFSICGLLMRYRDLFRSEKGLMPWAEIRREEIAEWIERKESLWPELEKQGFRDISIDGAPYPPFDIFKINQALKGKGLICGAGYGMYLKPTFFLAEIRTVGEISDHTVYTSDRELVRDLFTSPAMLQGRCIFLRLEPLKMLLWEKFSELSAGRGFALEDAFSRYGLRAGRPLDDRFKKQLEQMAENYSDALLRHELAESLEDVPEWKNIVSTAGDRKAEHYVRAIKDLIADTSDHGPLKRIIEAQDRGALSLSVGLMEGYRRVLYPEIKEAYVNFLRNDSWGLIEEARKAGHARFQGRRRKILDLYGNNSREDFVRKLKELVQGEGREKAA